MKYLHIYCIGVLFFHMCIINGIVGSRTSKKRRMALYDHGIVQKKDGRLPPEDLTIEFKNGKIANYGNTLSPLQTQERPWVQWSAHPDHYYSLVMTVCLEAPMFVRLCAGEYFRGSYRVGFRFIRDWDAPNRKSHSMREWLHWMVVNIPSFNVPKGDTLTQYVGPHPKSNSGFHRYVFTIFTQKNITMRFNEPLRMRDEFETRPNFSTTGFAEKYNLGYPYAVNFIRVQYHGNYVNPFDDKVKIIDPDEIKLPL